MDHLNPFFLFFFLGPICFGLFRLYLDKFLSRAGFNSPKDIILPFDVGNTFLVVPAGSPTAAGTHLGLTEEQDTRYHAKQTSVTLPNDITSLQIRTPAKTNS
jgi:hypothetical protein